MDLQEQPQILDQDPIPLVQDIEKVLSPKSEVFSDHQLEMIKQKESLIGKHSVTVVSSLCKAAKVYNQHAMKLLNEDKFQTSIKIFKALLKIMKDYEHPQVYVLSSLTLNNMSCTYKRLGKIESAQKYLEQALEIEQTNNLNDQEINVNNTSFECNASLTELNLCAIYSQLKNHKKGKQFAEMAVRKIEMQLESLRMKLGILSDEKKAQNASIYNEKLQMLAIANFNLGSQHEFLSEFRDSITRYELGLSLLLSLPERSTLETDFINSIKQVKTKLQAQQMKGPDRTFTNLSKGRISEQYSLGSFSPASDAQQALQFGKHKEAVSLTRKQRPQSAQLQNQFQFTAPTTNQSDLTYQQQQNLRNRDYEDIQPLTLQMNERKPRPTSSYVNRDIPRLTTNQLYTQSFTNVRSSKAETQNDDSIEKGLFQQLNQGSDKKLPSSMATSFNQNPQHKWQPFPNLQEPSDVIEVINDDEEDGEQELPHPLMIPRKKGYTQGGPRTRPISAKTTFTQQSNYQKSVQTLNQAARQPLNRNQSHTHSNHQYNSRSGSRQRSIDKIYLEAEQQVKMLKRQRIPSGKPPKKSSQSNLRGSQQKSAYKHQNLIPDIVQLPYSDQFSNQPVRPRSSSKSGQASSKSFLNQSGIQDRQQLFELIDRSFNQIEHDTEALIQTANRFKTTKNVDIRELYARENQLQSQIFFYNNRVLPQVVEKLEKPRQSIVSSSAANKNKPPPFFQGKERHPSAQRNNIQVYGNYGMQPATQAVVQNVRRHHHKITQKKGKQQPQQVPNFIRHEFNDSLNQSDLHPIMNIISGHQQAYPFQESDQKDQMYINNQSKKQQTRNVIKDSFVRESFGFNIIGAETGKPYRTIGSRGEKRLKLYHKVMLRKQKVLFLGNAKTSDYGYCRIQIIDKKSHFDLIIKPILPQRSMVRLLLQKSDIKTKEPIQFFKDIIETNKIDQLISLGRQIDVLSFANLDQTENKILGIEDISAIQPTPDETQVAINSIEKNKIQNVVKIQSFIRGWLTRQRMKLILRQKTFFKRNITFCVDSVNLYCTVFAYQLSNNKVLVKVKPQIKTQNTINVIDLLINSSIDLNLCNFTLRPLSQNQFQLQINQNAKTNLSISLSGNNQDQSYLLESQDVKIFNQTVLLDITDKPSQDFINKEKPQDDEEELKPIEQLVQDIELVNTVSKIQSLFRVAKKRKDKKKNNIEPIVEEIKAESQHKVIKSQKIESHEQVEQEEELKPVSVLLKDVELVQTVTKIQSVFRGAKKRKEIKNIQPNYQKPEEMTHQKDLVIQNETSNLPLQQQEELQPIDKLSKDLELVTTVTKIQSVFRGAKTRKKVQVQIKAKSNNEEEAQGNHQTDTDIAIQVNENQDIFEKLSEPNVQQHDDKELIYIYQIEQDQSQEKALISLYINEKKMLIILKCESCDTLSVYLDDFMARYKSHKAPISTKEDVHKFLRQILPKVTKIQHSKIILQSKQFEDQSQENDEEEAINTIMTSDQGENMRTLNADELRELIQSTNNLDDAFLQFYGNAESVDEKNLLMELKMPGLKVLQGQISELDVIVFKDIIDNMFIRFKLSHDPSYLRIERLNPDQIRTLSGNQKLQTLPQISDALKQELHIRLGLLNNGLDDNEYLSIEKIEKIIYAYTFKALKEEEPMQNMEHIIKKTQMIQNAFRKKKAKQVKKIEETKVQSVNVNSQRSVESRFSDKLKNMKTQDKVPKLIIRKSLSHQTSQSMIVKSFKKSQITILKQKISLSGHQCNCEVKSDYETDQLIVKVTLLNNQLPIEQCFQSSDLHKKTLKDLTLECQDLLSRLDFNESFTALVLRDGLADCSILSQDVILRKGLEIDHRFFLVTVAMQDSNLVIDAVEDKTEKRLQVKIKRQRKKGGDDAQPSEREILKLVNRLAIVKIELNENDVEETLTLK